MPEQFPIIDVPLDAPEADEDLGTKEKFWFRHRDLGLCLFKKARPNTGEDWAEKIAAELYELLGLPHADYELAIFNGENGIVSPSFLPPQEGAILTLGNEILARIVSNSGLTQLAQSVWVRLCRTFNINQGQLTLCGRV